MTHVRKPHQILCLLVLFTFPSLAVAQEETASIELPRPATTATEETPSWFSVGAAYRFRFENREASGFREGNDDGYGLSQILIDIGIKPTSWLNFHFQGQDARAPGKENANGVFRDPFDVRQAWVEIGDPKKGWIHARVGRQELLYGGQRLIGPLAWTNTARQFDAAKVTVGKDDLGFDVFAASVVQIDPTGFNRHRDENNLHGIYGRLNRLVPGSKLEAFILLKTTPPSSSVETARRAMPIPTRQAFASCASSPPVSIPRWKRRGSSARLAWTIFPLGAATGFSATHRTA